jgi:hypothetical protein
MDDRQSTAPLSRWGLKTGSNGFAENGIFHLGNVMEVTR